MTETDGSGEGGEGLIPIAKAARLLMVGEERVRQLQKLGYIPKAKRGWVSLVGAVHGRLRQLEDAARESSKSAADQRMKAAKADLLQQQFTARAGAHVAEAVTEALAAVDEVAGGLRADLAALPARHCTDLAQRRALADAIDKAFDDAAKRATAVRR